jgi:hypothetical protein
MYWLVVDGYDTARDPDGIRDVRRLARVRTRYRGRATTVSPFWPAAVSRRPNLDIKSGQSRQLDNGRIIRLGSTL